jgi:hypothetical protein
MKTFSDPSKGHGGQQVSMVKLNVIYDLDTDRNLNILPKLSWGSILSFDLYSDLNKGHGGR